MVKKFLIAAAVLFLLIQFIRPERNLSGENSNDFSKKYEVPEEVSNIMSVACNDCHTNKTNYPWYSNIQPINWWITEHVDNGKEHLNLSTFLSRPIAVQNHKLEEIIEQVEEKEMPLPSYTKMGMHAEANLSEEQRQILINWAKAQMAELKAQYPPDSLIMRRRPRPSNQ